MNTRLITIAGALLLAPVFAHADCDSTKSMISEKIKANGVDKFSLKVVSDDQADSAGGQKVGTCEGNKTIVYMKGGSDSGDMSSDDSSSKGSMSAQPASSSSS